MNSHLRRWARSLQSPMGWRFLAWLFIVIAVSIGAFIWGDLLLASRRAAVFAVVSLLALVASMVALALSTHDELGEKGREALFQSERRFRQLADAMPQIVWTAEADGTIDYGNATVLEYTGTSVGEYGADTWLSMLHPDDVERTQRAWRAAVQGGHDYDVEFRLFRTADQSYRWHRVRAVPIRDDEGRIVKWYGTATDEHDNRMARDRLAELANKLNTTLETISEAFFALDREWRFTYLNKESERLMGRKREDLIGKCMWDEFPEVRGTVAETGYRKALDEQRTVEFELAFRPRNRTFLIRAYPSPDSLTVYFADITERRRLELFKDEQTAILERMTSGAPLCELLAGAIRMIEAHDAQLHCMIALLDDDGTRLVEAHGPSLPDDFLATVPQLAPDAVLRERGADGSMAQAGLDADPLWKPLCERAHALGFVACWTVPVRSAAGHVFGAFVVFSPAARAPQPFETEMISSSAHIASIALEARRTEAELEYRSTHDLLTGLANRNLLRDRASQAIARARSRGEQVWIAFLNIDRFNVFNQTLGQDAGDALLKTTAERIRETLGPVSTVARWGGDEFVLVLPEGLDELAASQLANRLMDAVAQPLPIQGKTYFPSCSAGVAVFPADGGGAEVLVRNAQVAMHMAKEGGGRTLQFFTAAMNERAVDRLRLESDLRHALERNELVLHYQPQVDLRTGRVVGMEALVRWEHPELGLLNPERFIPAAEDSGLIVPIGAWVMRTACEAARRWRDTGFGDLCMAVNLSAVQFNQPDLVHTVRGVLAESGLDAHFLDIELNEGLVMHDVERALGVMHDLKALGVRLSMDDFGTGYSSLSYLKRFPIDVLKIDKSFVRNITTDPDEAAIARSIISLSHSLQLHVIAEGVETEEQLAFLRRHRCDQIQGYYFSRPLPEPQFTELLADERALPAEDRQHVPEQTLLIVDDEANVRAALYRLLRNEGYRILRAANAEEGLALLALHEVQVVVSDHRMPGMSGTEFLSRVKALHPDTIRIMLSGYTAVESIIEATNSGAVFRFHTKPWDDEGIRASIAEAFRYHWLIHGADNEHAAAAQ